MNINIYIYLEILKSSIGISFVLYLPIEYTLFSVLAVWNIKICLFLSIKLIEYGT